MTRQRAATWLQAALMAALLLALGFTLVLEDPAPPPPPLPTEPVDREQLEIMHRARGLIAEHDCWLLTDKAPVDIPSHAVVTTHSGATLYVSELGTTKALEDIFEGTTNFRQVHAFCR